MAVFNIVGFETGLTGTGAAGEVSALAGTATLASTTAKRTSAYGLLVNPTTTNTGYVSVNRRSALGANVAIQRRYGVLLVLVQPVYDHLCERRGC